MSRIDKAVLVATQVHLDQTDLGGNPYILHPIRVLAAVEMKIRDLNIKDTESVLCSAVLHDCIEDCDDKDAMYVIIEKEFGPTVSKAVDSLTRRPNETWKHYMTRVKKHWSPRIIKMADLDDNLDNSRLKVITETDMNRNKMYQKALNELIAIEESHGRYCN